MQWSQALSAEDDSSAHCTNEVLAESTSTQRRGEERRGQTHGMQNVQYEVSVIFCGTVTPPLMQHTDLRPLVSFGATLECFLFEIDFFTLRQ